MSVTQVTVTFGSQSTEELESEIQRIYNAMSEEDREFLDFIRDKRVNAAIVVDAGGIMQYFGSKAVNFLRSFGSVARNCWFAERRSSDIQEFPVIEPPEEDTHLSKTRFAPFAQYSEVSPTPGQYWQYVPHLYLPEENMGMYDHPVQYPITHRFTREDMKNMHVDGRTRLPSQV